MRRGDPTAGQPQGRWARALRGLLAAGAGVATLVGPVALANRPCAPEVRDRLGSGVATLVLAVCLAVVVLVVLCRVLGLSAWVSVAVLGGWLAILAFFLALDAERLALPFLVLWAPLAAALLPPRRDYHRTGPTP